MAEVTHNYEMEMLDALRPVREAIGLNGPAFNLLCLAAAEKGKPILALTLGDVAEITEETKRRYEAMHNKLEKMGGKDGSINVGKDVEGGSVSRVSTHLLGLEEER